MILELDATVVCAYRRDTFDAHALGAMTCVHPINVGLSVEPQFQILAADTHTWRLTGEVDFAVADVFAGAINAAVGVKPCHLDVSNLDFVDVAGSRAVAQAVVRSAPGVTVVGHCATLERCWSVADFNPSRLA